MVFKTHVLREDNEGSCDVRVLYYSGNNAKGCIKINLIKFISQHLFFLTHFQIIRLHVHVAFFRADERWLFNYSVSTGVTSDP